ncbi:MAG: hypothetical protein AB1700_05480, partial [Bacillota bacterium]
MGDRLTRSQIGLPFFATKVAQGTQSLCSNSWRYPQIGVGTQSDEDLLIAMAEAAQGDFYYVRNMDEIPKVFEQELTGLAKDETADTGEKGNVQEGKGILEGRVKALEDLSRDYDVEDPEIKEEIGNLKSLI